MIDPAKLKKNIISDMRVELSEEFDRNFTRKAFFTEKWKKRRNPHALGSLLLVTGTLRRSIDCKETDKGVRFTSQVPYATLHNEGGKGSVTVRQHVRKGKKGKTHVVRQHTRTVNVPQRQFIGDGEDTRRIVGSIIADNVRQYNDELVKTLRK